MTPVLAAMGMPFLDISAGQHQTCGIGTDSTAYCWGGGWLGNDTLNVSFAPVAVNSNEKFVSISTGYEHVCALNATNSAFCWGLGLRGKLGTGTEDVSFTPTPAAVGFSFSSLEVGVLHSCGLTVAGGMYCWGLEGVLGDGVTPVSGMAQPRHELHRYQCLDSASWLLVLWKSQATLTE